MTDFTRFHISRYRATLILIVLLVAISSLGAGDWKSVDAGQYHMEWMVDGPFLHVRVSAPVEGWVAVGFDPTSRMNNANIIIGYVDGGTVEISDQFGSSPISHAPDTSKGGTDNVTDISGSETGGVTQLAFTIPLNSGDSRDRPLVEGRTYTVIFASNRADKMTRKHQDRTSVSIVL